MELYQLSSFVKVAELGSVTRASEELFLTQPAVTQHIKLLERELDTLLFDRVGRGVRLTEAGRVLWDYARRGFSVFDECRQALTDLEECRMGTLTIGAGVTTSVFYLPELLRAFQEECPQVDIVVRTGRSKEVAAMVVEQEIDLGLVTSAVDHSAVVSEELFEEEIALVAAPGQSETNAVSVRELAQVPLILFPRDTGFRRYLDGALASAGIAASVKMEIDSVEAIKSFVAVGLGASFLPESAVAAEIEAGHLARIEIDGLGKLSRKTTMIRRKDRYVSAAAGRFIDTLRGRHRE